jgi:D-alanyl-lipoteichoic acid acyltransferase DltB (MBOAT superfamily)
VTVLSTYFLAIGLKYSNQNGSHHVRSLTIRRLYLIAAVAINVGILLYFKYCNFFIASINDFANVIGISLSLRTLNIVIPIGVSFYTFSALSYVFDVYYRRIEPTKDLIAYSTFVAFFPALLSGPISRATDQLTQYLSRRQFKYSNMSSAFKAIVLGIFMKVCVADRLGLYVDSVYSNIWQHTGTSLFIAQLMYTFQIYADFAGYSLMAIGSGLFFGIELPVNFSRPYFSSTVTEFWRKWHISLTSWFRDYIYFPMGGSRVSQSRWIMNIMLVFIISGLWHGAAYTFLVWGILHGVVMVIEKLIYGKRAKNISDKWGVSRVLRLCITFTIVSFLWIFFRANDISEACIIIKKILMNHGSVFIDQMTFICGIMSLAILLLKEFCEEFVGQKCGGIAQRCCSFILYSFLISYILLFGVLDGGQFIYSQF